MNDARRRRWMVWSAVTIVVGLRVVTSVTAALDDRVPHCEGADAQQLDVALVLVEPVDPQRTRVHARVVADPEVRCRRLSGIRLRLNWYYPPALAAGEVWRVNAVVRPPWGYQNPGGFDYERWLLSEGLAGTGYVREGVRLRTASPGLVHRYREWVGGHVGHLPNGGYLAALASGASTAITDDQWGALRRTGTVHLLVISGLHTGLIAVFGYYLGLAFARVLPRLGVWITARQVAAACSILFAAGFTVLSGSEVPAVRAWLMTTFATVALTVGREVAPGCWLLAAVACILYIFPLSVIDQGFWLSFGAVTVLVLGLGRRVPRPGRVQGLVHAQLLMFLGMTPIVAAIVGELVTVAAPANLFAVPWVSFVVVPLVFAGVLGSAIDVSLGAFAWDVADGSLELLTSYLALLGGGAPRTADPPAWLAVVSLLGLALLLATRDGRSLALAAPLWLAWAIIDVTRVPPGEVRVTALDVGQGTAVLVDTARHRLLFDAGARFASGFDLGEAVVAPAIAASGALRLDRLIVSHGDIDHAGGAGAVRRRVPTGDYVGSPDTAAARACVRGQRWSWDRVEFEFIHPGPRAASGTGGNEASCVLLITAGDRRALLTGDIGKLVEIALVARLGGPVDLLLAPHHGSATSSSARFVEHTRPRVVIYSAGLNNRYGHPHEAVDVRYAAVGAERWITGRDGALTWESWRGDRVEAWRRDHRRWWVNTPPVE